MEISQMITKTFPISMRIISYAIKWGIPLWIWWKVNGNWDNNMITISQWRGSFVEQILASEDRNKSIRVGLWESQSGIPVGKLTIWVRSFKIRSISSTKIGMPALWWLLKSPKKNTLADRLIKRTSSMLEERIKNRAQRQTRWSIEEKEVRDWMR